MAKNALVNVKTSGSTSTVLGEIQVKGVIWERMKQISIPSSYYWKLEAAARAHGLTIDQYVDELVKREMKSRKE